MSNLHDIIYANPVILVYQYWDKVFKVLRALRNCKVKYGRFGISCLYLCNQFLQHSMLYQL